MPEEGEDPSIERPVVFDASVLINFGKVGAFQILRSLYAGAAIVVEEVRREVRDRRSKARLEEAITEGWVKAHFLRTALELYWLAVFSERLGPGEAASLAAAKVNGWRFASDDLTAREIAEAELPPRSVFGSIRILVKAVKQSVCSIEEADRWHRRMVEAGYHSPVSSIHEFLEGQ